MQYSVSVSLYLSVCVYVCMCVCVCVHVHLILNSTHSAAVDVGLCALTFSSSSFTLFYLAIVQFNRKFIQRTDDGKT